LPGDLLTEYCIEPIQEIVAGVKSRFPAHPIIVFAKGVGHRHSDIYLRTKCQAIGVEAECPLEFLQSILPASAVIQGNLDPLLLLCDEAVVRRETLKLVSGIPRNRHIFNLGHGIKQQTNPDILTTVIETIRIHDHG
jgi:uroporphyrinogen decarboxylase